jgi:two-component system, NtrC family, response regulator AtoC
MRLLLYQVQQIARASGPVLITGESGVGKELVAHAIHEQSDRSERLFVAVNCAGIPENLLESELFGHAAGAFTGAQRPRRGLFAEADGGVLFLDEVTELPLTMQAKLLRVLQEQTIRPVGANKEETVDVRVLAASNRELVEEVREKRLRQDLYYRLETFVLHVPALRQREGDLELLAAKFLARYSRELGKEIHSFSPEALRLIRHYPFPGNVRELQNVIKRAAAFSHGETILLEDLPESIKQTGSSPDPLAMHGIPAHLMNGPAMPTLEEMKARYIKYVLARTKGNKRRAATLLGIGRHTLYAYLVK